MSDAQGVANTKGGFQLYFIIQLKFAVPQIEIISRDKLGFNTNNYRLNESARGNGHESFRYLTVVLTELLNASQPSEYEKLMPWNLTPVQVVGKSKKLSYSVICTVI